MIVCNRVAQSRESLYSGCASTAPDVLVYISISDIRVKETKKSSMSGVQGMRNGDAFTSIEEIVQRDEGGRGIKVLCLPGELQKAALALTATATTKVAIITGFPCMLDYTPPTETDGPLGALAIARACLAIGKQVVLMTDECNEEVLLAATSASGLYSYLSTHEDNGDEFAVTKLSLHSFPPAGSFDDREEARLWQAMEDVQVVVAIERTGPSQDGTYRTMRKRDMTAIVAPLDRILLRNPTDNKYVLPSVSASIGIGDGGNEVGMGKVFDKILESSIPNAADIACVTTTDYLLTASVSNWGGYALAAAVAVASANASTDPQSAISTLLAACLPDDATETAICEAMVAAGARDGISGELALCVDGMPLQRSLDILNEIRRTAATSTQSFALP